MQEKQVSECASDRTPCQNEYDSDAELEAQMKIWLRSKADLMKDVPEVVNSETNLSFEDTDNQLE